MRENNSKSSFRSAVLPSFLIGFIMFGNSMITPLLPIYAATYLVSDTLTGMLVSLFGLGRLLVNIPAGALSQRIGRRPLMCAGPLIIAAACASAAMTTSFMLLLISRFIQGIGSGIYMTSSMSALMDTATPSNRAGRLAFYQTAQTMGLLMGPTLGGLIAQELGFTAPFWVYMAVTLGIAIIAILFFRETLRPASERVIPPPSSTPARFNLAFWAACAANFSIFFTRSGGEQFLFVMIAHFKYGLSPLEIGLIFSISATTNLVSIPLGGYMVGRVGAAPVTMTLLSVMLVLLLTVVFVDSKVVFLGCFLVVGVVQGMLSGSVINMAVESVPEHRLGPSIGMQRSLGDVAVIFAPFLLGMIKDTFLFEAHTMVAFNAAVCALALAAVLAVVLGRPKNA